MKNRHWRPAAARQSGWFGTRWVGRQARQREAMRSIDFDLEARRISGDLPPEPRLVVIGSSAFWGSDTESICRACGSRLADIENLTLITGGVTGVGETVGRAFHQARESSGAPSRVFHILPVGSDSWDYGVTLFVGNNMLERREVLVRLGRVCLALEGGPGTDHEASVALSQGLTLIPVGRTGGASGKFYGRMSCPKHLDPKSWGCLGNPQSELLELTDAIGNLVTSSLSVDA